MSLIVASGVVWSAGIAEAAKPKPLGTFGRWSAFVVADGNSRHCFVYSKPTQEKGDYTRRGEVSVTISHRTKGNVRNEISFRAGYPLAADSEVEVVIDGSRRFTLFVDDESAWAPDAQTDAALREAIERGREMTVRGRSKRGTKTTDTYSLSGTSAALARIDRECKG